MFYAWINPDNVWIIQNDPWNGSPMEEAKAKHIRDQIEFAGEAYLTDFEREEYIRMLRKYPEYFV